MMMYNVLDYIMAGQRYNKQLTMGGTGWIDGLDEVWKTTRSRMTWRCNGHDRQVIYDEFWAELNTFEVHLLWVVMNER